MRGIRLEVAGFHLLPVPSGDPAAGRTARLLGVPVDRVGQMHLLLTVRNGSAGSSSVAGDVLRLRFAGRTLEATTPDVFPPGPLLRGERVETAVGFDVAARAGGAGHVQLEWTHAGVVTVVPVGSARRSG